MQRANNSSKKARIETRGSKKENSVSSSSPPEQMQDSFYSPSINHQYFEKFSQKKKQHLYQLDLKFQEIRRKKHQFDLKNGYYDISSQNQFKYIYGQNYRHLKNYQERVQAAIEKKQEQMMSSPPDRGNIPKERPSQMDHTDLFDLQCQSRILENQFNKESRRQEVLKMKLKLAWREKQSSFFTEFGNFFQNRYLILQLIGAGGFGEVYRVFDLKQERMIAIKLNIFKIDFEDPDMIFEIYQQFIHVSREIKTHAILQHQNIPKYYHTYTVYESKKTIFATAMQLCKGQDLGEYIVNGYHFSELEAKNIIVQILRVLEYLEYKKVIHYDLKPSNILYSKGVVKVIDFGLCKTMKQDQEEIELSSQGFGTMFYLPPQSFDTVIINEGSQTKKAKIISPSVDMWAAGIIFYQLLFLERPFAKGLSQSQIYESKAITKQLKLEFPNTREISNYTKDFITKCLVRKDERMTAEQGLCHNCFNGVQVEERGNIVGEDQEYNWNEEGEYEEARSVKNRKKQLEIREDNKIWNECNRREKQAEQEKQKKQLINLKVENEESVESEQYEKTKVLKRNMKKKK